MRDCGLQDVTLDWHEKHFSRQWRGLYTMNMVRAIVLALGRQVERGMRKEDEWGEDGLAGLERRAEREVQLGWYVGNRIWCCVGRGMRGELIEELTRRGGC